MNREYEINWWTKFTNKGEELGYKVAEEAGYLVDFLKSLKHNGNIFYTSYFNNYIEGLVRGFQINENEYYDCRISTTHDLHYIEFTEETLDWFFCRLKETIWKDRVEYAYYEAKVF